MPVELAKEIEAIIADGKISDQEHDSTISALKLALVIMSKQEERENDIRGEYEDKLKEKDGIIVKIGALIGLGFGTQSLFQFINNGTPPESILLSMLMFLASFGVSLGILLLKEKMPALVSKIKSVTDVIKPMVDPKVRQGLDVISEVLEK